MCNRAAFPHLPPPPSPSTFPFHVPLPPCCTRFVEQWNAALAAIVDERVAKAEAERVTSTWKVQAWRRDPQRRLTDVPARTDGGVGGEAGGDGCAR